MGLLLVRRPGDGGTASLGLARAAGRPARERPRVAGPADRRRRGVRRGTGPGRAAARAGGRHRHPTAQRWDEIARVLAPGGSHLCQGIGSGTHRVLAEALLGPLPGADEPTGDLAAEAARAAGLQVVDLRAWRCRVEFRDVGAVVHFLRKVVWTVPNFSVERYRPQLAEVHRRIERDGAFVSWSQRYLIEARRRR